MEVNRIYNEDCYEVLKRMPDKSVNLMMQDPPFGVTQNEWDVKPDLQKMWPQWERVIADNGAMLFFATQPFASELIMSNAKLYRYDLIWYKPLGSGFLNAKRMPMRNHEYVIVFYKALPTYNPQMGVGERKAGKVENTRKNENYGKFDQKKYHTFDDQGTRHPKSVIEFTNGDRTKESFHPTQKPVDLIRYLIKTYSNAGDLVFDGYGGSGTTAEACIIEKRDYIVCENKQEYFDHTCKRVVTASSKLTIF